MGASPLGAPIMIADIGMGSRFPAGSSGMSTEIVGAAGIPAEVVPGSKDIPQDVVKMGTNLPGHD